MRCSLAEKGSEMGKHNPFECQNCGGQIERKTMRCPYCDTQYERTIDGITEKYIAERPGEHRIQAMVRVSDISIKNDPERIERFVKERMSNRLAKALCEYMTITEEKDWRSFDTIFCGEVRVLIPDRR